MAFKVTKVTLEKPSGWESGAPEEQGDKFHGYMWPIYSYRNPKQVAGYLVGCPVCGRVGSLDHEVTFNEERQPTVHPSINCGYDDCDAHYWIIDGEIK